MRQTFEHLLGLPTETALALLTAAGVLNVQVVPTAAPPRRNPSAEDELRSALGEQQGYASTRVVAVQEDGRKLIVARFLTNGPRLQPSPGQETSSHSSPERTKP